MREVDWTMLLGIVAIIVGVLITPYQLLMVVHRIWEQRRRERIGRGEDVRPKKLPWNFDEYQ